jgi:hypothetical protein
VVHDYRPQTVRVQISSNAVRANLTLADYTFKLFQNPVLREKRQGLSI